MANTFELISSVTVGSGGASDITFSSIPQTYTDLVLKVSARGSSTGSAWEDLNLNINSAGWGTNISTKLIYGTGSGTGSNSVTTGAGGLGTNASITASTFGNSELYFPNYTSSTTYKSFSNDSLSENNATAALAVLLAGLYSSNTAITNVAIRPNAGTFVQYSTAYLYGVKNA